MTELTPREVIADWIEAELAECVPDPAAAATAILDRLRDAGFSVCATEKLSDAVGLSGRHSCSRHACHFVGHDRQGQDPDGGGQTTVSLRARRIASDEAHAWARNLRLGDPHAKLILCMLTLYVDGEGCCFVSIPSLAEDCEMSANTVRRRLAWLESIGVISRTPQWIDGQGRRNSVGPGRRTSDLIRLPISPSSQGGAKRISPPSVGVPQPVSPSLALQRSPPTAGRG